MLPTDFVGGVSDGVHGVAALAYKRDSLVGKKAWFFEDQALICLGAGITDTKGGNILTSVQQSLHQGNVMTSDGLFSKGKATLKKGDWVHHAGIGYLILEGDQPVLQCSVQEGDWNSIFTTKASSPAAGEVFSLWFDHGRNPNLQKYAYIMLPGKTATEMASLEATGISILSNTESIQAVSIKNGAGVRAVFYQPGQLEWAQGQVLKTDTPCIMSLTFSGDKTLVHLSEPTQKQDVIHFSLNGKGLNVKLPSGGEAGKTVEVEIMQND
jgi:chondroitin AC lyase